MNIQSPNAAVCQDLALTFELDRVRGQLRGYDVYQASTRVRLEFMVRKALSFGLILFCFGAAVFIYVTSPLLIHHIALIVYLMGQGAYLVYEYFKKKINWETWKQQRGTRTPSSTVFIIARDGLEVGGHQWPWNAIRQAVARPEAHRVDLEFAVGKARYVNAVKHIEESLDWFTLVLNENIRTFGDVTQLPEELQALRNDARPEEQ